MAKYKNFINYNKKTLTEILMLGFIIMAICIMTIVPYIFTPENNVTPSFYRIAIDESWYSLRDSQLYDKEQDLSAFSDDILQAIAAKKHFTVDIVPLDINDPFSGLDNGYYEAELSSYLLSEEESNEYISSNPYYLLGPVLVVPLSSPIKSMSDLKGKSIGVINKFESMYTLEKLYAINFVTFDFNDRYKLIDLLLNKNIDGMILNIIPAYEYAHGIYKHQLRIASAPLNAAGLRLIAKNSPEGKKLIDLFNVGLQDIQKNGTYHQLLIKWQLFNPELN